MTDEQQAEQVNAQAEAALTEDADQDDEDVEPDYLPPLEEFATEAAGDRERVKAVADASKAKLEEHKQKLLTLTVGGPSESATRDAVVATIDSQLLMLDEQSETFTLFLADLARLTAQNVEQLRNNDDELADAIENGGDDDDDAVVVTDSILMADDGNIIAAMLYEYMQQLQAAIPATPEGSQERAAATGRVQQLSQLIARVQEITVQEPTGAQPALPADAPQAGEPPALAPAPEQAQPQT